MKRYIVDVTISSMYLTPKLSERVQDLSISLLSDSKIITDSLSTCDSLSIISVMEETGIIQYSINHTISLVIKSQTSDFLNQGILSICQNIDNGEPKCLGYGQTSFQDNEDILNISQRLHLTNSTTTVAVIDYHYNLTQIEFDDENNPTVAAAVDPVEELNFYFDVTDIKEDVMANIPPTPSISDEPNDSLPM